MYLLFHSFIHVHMCLYDRRLLVQISSLSIMFPGVGATIIRLENKDFIPQSPQQGSVTFMS